jgi:hypothetical protein
MLTATILRDSKPESYRSTFFQKSPRSLIADFPGPYNEPARFVKTLEQRMVKVIFTVFSNQRRLNTR